MSKKVKVSKGKKLAKQKAHESEAYRAATGCGDQEIPEGRIQLLWLDQSKATTAV